MYLFRQTPSACPYCNWRLALTQEPSRHDIVTLTHLVPFDSLLETSTCISRSCCCRNRVSPSPFPVMELMSHLHHHRVGVGHGALLNPPITQSQLLPIGFLFQHTFIALKECSPPMISRLSYMKTDSMARHHFLCQPNQTLVTKNLLPHISLSLSFLHSVFPCQFTRSITCPYYFYSMTTRRYFGTESPAIKLWCLWIILFSPLPFSAFCDILSGAACAQSGGLAPDNLAEGNTDNRIGHSSILLERRPNNSESRSNRLAYSLL